MAISIHEALQLPVMHNAKLIAGHKGVNNIIKWVTIVEVLEDIHRLQEGEFLITTGFGIHENPDRKEVFHKLLKSNKLSGIVICTSFYMKEIPKSFISAVNESDLPLIEIPTDINFSEITKAILEQIVNNQIHLLEYSSNIHRKLTNLVLNNRSLNEITHTLADLTSATTVIYNDLYDVVHYKLFKESKVNKTTLVIQNTEIDIKLDLYQSYEQETTIHKIISNYKITICPIIAKQCCYGWITMIKPLDDWKELDDIAIEHAATIYAMEFLKKEAVEETKMRLQGDFLEGVFNQSYLNEKVIFEQGRKLGYDLSLKQSVFYFMFEKPDTLNENSLEKLYQVIEQLLKQKNKQHLIQTKFDSLILLTNVLGNNKIEISEHCFQLATEIKKQWLYFFPNSPLKIGIGKHYDAISLLSQSAREAQYAVRLSDLVNSHSKITHYDDLGMYDLLLKMKESGIDLSTLYSDNLEHLIPTSHKGMDLIETLDIYLMNNQNIQIASDQLFIHRHTLRYRLNQIEIRTGLDIKLADERLSLQLSIMAYKLVKLLAKK